MKRIFLVALALISGIGLMAQKSWTEIKTPSLKFREIGPALTSGRVSDLAIDAHNPDRWFVAAASGGVWLTENHGTTFSPVFDQAGSYSVGCISIDPNNPNVIWVGTGENNAQRSVAYGDGIYKSEDGGKSWKNMGLKRSEHIAKIWINPNNSEEIWVACQGPLWSSGGERGLYQSLDGGASWKSLLTVDEHTGITDFVVDPRHNGHVYAAAWQRQRKVWTLISGGPSSALYQSKDFGKTWVKAKNGFPEGEVGRIALALNPLQPDRIFAMVEASGDKAGFYVSENRGASWSKTNSKSTSGNYYQEIIPDPTDPDVVYVMDTYGHVTRDAGKTFERIPEGNKHVDNHAIWIDPQNNEHWIMGCDGGVYETYNGGSHWDYKANLPITQFYKITADSAKPFYNVYGGTQDNYSLGGPSQTKSANGIRNSDWFVTNGGDGFQTVVDPTNPDVVYSQSQYGWLVRFQKKTGEKMGIKPRNVDSLPAFRWNWDAPLILSRHNAKTLYFAANHLFKSTNQGSSWEIISPDLSRQLDRSQLKVMNRYWAEGTVAWNKSTSDYGNITALAESPLKQGVLWVGTDDGLVHVSRNDGKAWQEVKIGGKIPAQTYVADIICSDWNTDEVWVVFNNHKNGDFKPYIMRTTNGGSSWVPVNGDLPQNGAVYSLAPFNTDLWFVGTEFGAYYTLNSGKNWKKLNGLPTIAVRDLAIHYGEHDLVAGTFGRGMWVLDDFSPLLSLKQLGEGLVKPLKPFQVYVQNTELGRSGNAYQGSALFSAANPEPGVSFTYYLSEVEQAPISIRRKQEKDISQAPIPYPSKSQLYSEETFQSPKLKITINNAQGQYVHHIWTNAAAGLQSVFWNFRTGSNEAADKVKFPWGDTDWGGLALPGSYTAQMELLDSKGMRSIGTPITFHVEAFELSDPASIEAVRSFRVKAQETLDFISRLGKKHKEVQQLWQQTESAVFVSPNTVSEDLDKLKAWKLRLDQWTESFQGDDLLRSRYFTVKEGLNERAGSLRWNAFMTLGTLTESLITLEKELVEDAQKMEATLLELEREMKSYDRK